MDKVSLFGMQVKAVVRQTAILLFETKFWVFHGAILLLSVLQSGVWYSPQTERLLLISKDIHHNPFLDQPTNQWLLSSFLGPLLGHLTRLNQSVLSYSAMHLVLFLVIFSGQVLIVKQRYGDFTARIVLVVFFLSPLSSVLFTWLGSPDIITALLAMTLVIYSKTALVLVLSSFLLGINHPEQGFVIISLLTIFYFLTQYRKFSLRFAFFSLAGLWLGKTLVDWHFSYHHFLIEFTRLDYLPNAGFQRYLSASLNNPSALLFSLYNVLLIFIIGILFTKWKQSRVTGAFLIYSILAFITVLATLDQTRVFSLLSFPAVLLLVLTPSYRNLELHDVEFTKSLAACAFIAGVVIPRFVVWDGNVYFSVYRNWLEILIRQAW